LTLIPIRIDLDIQPFMPSAALPPPTTYSHLDLSQPIYRQGEQTVPFRLKDTFLWNLHESLTTIDQFAQTMVQDLDLPRRSEFAQEIAKQIRNQLEDWATVALHPLFHTQQVQTSNGIVTALKQGGVSTNASQTPALSGSATPLRNGTSHLNDTSVSSPFKQATSALQEITASATAITPDSEDFNPDDMYRCIVNLNINLANYLYTDQFEWSLLHPVGTAELFAKQTCADLGLNGEWVATMTHAIYEAVLKLKKEACESGGLVGGGLIRNDAAHDAEAGWRYDPEHLADSWEPKIEILSKEEIDKREVERERAIRVKRRETQRFVAGGNQQPVENRGGYFDEPTGEERMGRGERSKKKRRWRSLSPQPGVNTPGARGTPDVGGYGGGVALADDQRNTWQCTHCKIWGSSVWAVRDGPAGPKVCVTPS
jgi:chromatin structure-remodeling complex subunit SFH1